MNSIAASADAEQTPALTRVPDVRVVIGPTAAGKSSLALAMARELGLAIVSADSRQVYEQFDVGTAKPSRAERASVPHFGIDVVSPEERYSASKWALSAQQWIDDAHVRGTPPLIVGGTGFYVRALVQPLAVTPELPDQARRGLATWMDRQSITELRRICARLDPARAELGRTQLCRAIETALLAGVRLGDALHASSRKPSSDEAAADVSGANTVGRAVRYLVVDPGPVLATRIHDRVSVMLKAGWVEEVETLMKHVSPTAPAWLASGYDVIRRHVAGEWSLDVARERIIIETRQYAKRQRTWCRHQLGDGPVTHLSPDDPRALQRALAWWHGQGERA